MARFFAPHSLDPERKNVIGVIAMIYSLFIELGHLAPSSAGPVASWGLMAATSGLVCTSPHGSTLIAFTMMATIVAPTAVEVRDGWVVLAVVGYPLLLAVAFSVGHNRRSYQVQARQSAALPAQSEQLRAEQKQVAVLDERNRIAREIHDVLAHSLGALGITIQPSLVSTGPGSPSARRRT